MTQGISNERPLRIVGIEADVFFQLEELLLQEADLPALQVVKEKLGRDIEEFGARVKAIVIEGDVWHGR